MSVTNLNSARYFNANLRVCCRIRPVAITKQEELTDRVVYKETAHDLLLFDPRHKGVNRRFNFDRIFAEETTKTIFSEEVEPHLEKLFRGEHVTLFAHGAAGSGKTFTLEGRNSKDPTPSTKGITPLAIERILQFFEDGTHSRNEYKVVFSLYEIYCEKVRDLLQNLDEERGRYKVSDLPIQKDLNGFEVIPDLKEVEIVSIEDFWQKYKSRVSLRRKGKTLLNEESSRSHCFCVVKVVKRSTVKEKAQMRRGSSMTFHERPKPPQTGNLYLVDLAGCEDNRQSGNSGQRMLESQAINDTYLSLIKVFNALKRRLPLSAFCRDSKLTRLLRGALESKDSPTIVIITASPFRSRFQATNNTFSYLHFEGAIVDAQDKANDLFEANYKFQEENFLGNRNQENIQPGMRYVSSVKSMQMVGMGSRQSSLKHMSSPRDRQPNSARGLMRRNPSQPDPRGLNAPSKPPKPRVSSAQRGRQIGILQRRVMSERTRSSENRPRASSMDNNNSREQSSLTPRREEKNNLKSPPSKVGSRYGKVSGSKRYYLPQIVRNNEMSYDEFVESSPRRISAANHSESLQDLSRYNTRILEADPSMKVSPLSLWGSERKESMAKSSSCTSLLVSPLNNEVSLLVDPDYSPPPSPKLQKTAKSPNLHRPHVDTNNNQHTRHRRSSSNELIDYDKWFDFKEEVTEVTSESEDSDDSKSSADAQKQNDCESSSSETSVKNVSSTEGEINEVRTTTPKQGTEEEEQNSSSHCGSDSGSDEDSCLGKPLPDESAEENDETTSSERMKEAGAKVRLLKKNTEIIPEVSEKPIEKQLHPKVKKVTEDIKTLPIKDAKVKEETKHKISPKNSKIKTNPVAVKVSLSEHSNPVTSKNQQVTVSESEPRNQKKKMLQRKQVNQHIRESMNKILGPPKVVEGESNAGDRLSMTKIVNEKSFPSQLK